MLSARYLINNLGGIARGTQLAQFGYSRRLLSHAVDAGEIWRLRPGVFATAAASTEVRIAAGHGGALTCAGALSHHGVWVLAKDESPHVWLGPAGRVHHNGCSCVAHYRSGRMTLGVVDVETALVHSYFCRGEEFFFCALESAWNARRIGAAGRVRIRAALPRSAHWLCDFAHGDSESGLESLIRLRLHLLGIPVQAQVRIPGVGRVDFVIAGRVILEADGAGNHDGVNHRHRDLHRDAAASALGYESLRFDYAMIVHDWSTVVTAILAAINRAAA